MKKLHESIMFREEVKGSTMIIENFEETDVSVELISEFEDWETFQ